MECYVCGARGERLIELENCWMIPFNYYPKSVYVCNRCYKRMKRAINRLVEGFKVEKGFRAPENTPRYVIPNLKSARVILKNLKEYIAIVSEPYTARENDEKNCSRVGVAIDVLLKPCYGPTQRREPVEAPYTLIGYQHGPFVSLRLFIPYEYILRDLRRRVRDSLD